MSPFSRREFLEGGAGLVAAAGLLPTARAESVQPPSQVTLEPAPRSTITIVVNGTVHPADSAFTIILWIAAVATLAATAIAWFLPRPVRA